MRRIRADLIKSGKKAAAAAASFFRTKQRIWGTKLELTLHWKDALLKFIIDTFHLANCEVKKRCTQELYEKY